MFIISIIIWVVGGFVTLSFVDSTTEHPPKHPIVRGLIVMGSMILFVIYFMYLLVIALTKEVSKRINKYK